MCFGCRIAEYTSSGQMYSDEKQHDCHGYKDKLFAPSFDMWCPNSNSVFTKAIIAKHSICTKNNFGKSNGASKHLKRICSVGKQIHDKGWSSSTAFQCLYLLSGSWCKDPVSTTLKRWVLFKTCMYPVCVVHFSVDMWSFSMQHILITTNKCCFQHLCCKLDISWN